MKKTVIFGAGQIGRGFIGDICSSSNYHLVFIDVSKQVVDLLNLKREYPVWLLGERKIEKKVDNLRAMSFTQSGDIAEEISDVDIVFTAVGANNLSLLSPVIAEGLKIKSRKNKGYCNIVICENLLGSAEVLRKNIIKNLSPSETAYMKENVGFVETVVSRMVAPLSDELRKKEPLLVTVEPYNILPVAKNSFKGEIPAVKGFYPVENIYPYEELKLFVHNLAHASLAYTGFQMGYEFIWECMEDRRLLGIMEGVTEETKSAIIKKHVFDRKEVENYISDLFMRFRNKALNDTVWRVGRDPLRKIGPNERISGGMKMCLREGIFPENICFVMASCLCYNYQDDKNALFLQLTLRDKGIDYVLRNISGIEDERIICEVKNRYNEIKERKSDSGNFKEA
ncbi:MAG TPA: hypothetical protein PKN36_03430 [bacterium]|nr:hypothetical protein [bacterium]